MSKNQISDYISSLPLPEAQQRLLEKNCSSVENARTKLDEEKGLEHWLLLGDSPADQCDQLLGMDECGRIKIKASPAVERTALLPEPWTTNVLVRFWARLRGRPVTPKRPIPSVVTSRWQAIGSRRRLVLLILLIVQTVVAAKFMKEVMPYQGWGLINFNEILEQSWLESARQVLPYVLQGSILVLFTILSLWVSAGFWTALMGFWELLTRRDRYSISGAHLDEGPIAKQTRTAVIMPICNEEVARVFAGLRATYESLARTGELEQFDFFVLSDTSDPDIAVAEQQAWLGLVQELGAHGRFFYRRRRRRVKRKSGNVDDFCRRWGSQYKYMLGLDADSVMTGPCIIGMVKLMEANPDAGIIQTSPRAVGMDTLYARVQQFATRLYGPLFTAGLHFWQLGESHYWGHNAIIRMKPFIEHCALAPLPGNGSFAGPILSHDFAEAALMRRAGFGVWIAYDLPGSYEELPPNLLDELKRDRRWCHGNLMNFRLFLVKGMHPVHRAVFLTGVLSYLSAPLWFCFLVLSTVLLATNTLMEPVYFLSPGQLYPLWPQWHPQEAIALFSMTMVLLFLPKVLSLILVWVKGAQEFGGPWKVAGSVVMEALLSVLLAPVRMVYHTRFVAAAFFGWAANWQSPQRDDDSTPWKESFKRHAPQGLLGLGWTAIVCVLNPGFLWWLSPIVVSLMLAIPVSVITSRTSLGLQSRQARWFLIPEEQNVPRELEDTYRYTVANRASAMTGGFLRAVVEPVLNTLAQAMATSRHRHSAALARSRESVIAEVGKKGLDALSPQARLKILDDPVILAHLHREVWHSSDSSWIEKWRKVREARRG
ncbi:glucans biosynthesis glucosyltransferase MdoH [Pseudomonas akapageensis]|uniref:glucans biosynthesis glucosyltransferase MdoH n=1 Tax=Pseudomonas akapageensis TaxID=2609961 RepID=UPI00140B4EED|nr:glucans biosynthesis glucosyltransferase MdoH [Pseudomonas akapageensis]